MIRVVGASMKAFWEIFYLGIVLCRRRPRVIHLCSSAGPAALRDIIVLALCSLTSARTILHFHTSCLPLDQSRGGMIWSASKIAVNLADTIIVLDRETEALINHQFPGKQVHRLANPLDVDSMKYSQRIDDNNALVAGRKQEASFKLVFVGRVVREKGVELLVRAASRSSRVLINLVGPVLDEYRERLIRIAKARDEGRWLNFTGEVSRTRVQDEISCADALALPSLQVYEAFPYAVLEGMAHAKPILATNVGAIPDMIGVGTGEIAGICVEHGNEQQLETALKHLRDHPDERKAMGINGQRRVRLLFDSSLISEQLRQIWLSVSGRS